MVSSVWFAWSKCPPLHPCCHRGNQAGQNNPESNSPSIYFTILSACRPVTASLHSSVPYRIFFLPLSSPFTGSRSGTGGTLLLFEQTLLNFWSLSPKTHTHTLKRTSCSCLFAPLPLFCASLYSSVSLYPPPLFRAPCLLMPLWYCRVL